MWINTKVEFQWDGTQYAEVACEGYEYSGEIAQCQFSGFDWMSGFDPTGGFDYQKMFQESILAQQQQQARYDELISGLGLTEQQQGLFGDDFYANLSEMFPGIPRETIEQFIMQPQMGRYETLLQQLQAQKEQEQAFLSEEYGYRGAELERQIAAQEAQRGFVETGYDITTADIDKRKKEEADRLGITTAALDRRLIEEADRLKITKDELERQKYAVGEELRITESDITAREQEAKDQTKLARDELGEQLADAEAQYGTDSPQYKRLQDEYDSAAARYSTEEGKEGYETLSRREKLSRLQELYGDTSAEARAIADQLSREETLYGEGGAESQAIAAELAQAGTARTLEAAQIASRAQAAQARYGTQGLEATRLRQATGRAAQRLGLEEARIGGQVGRAQQAYAAEAGRYAGQATRAGEAETAEITRVGGRTARAGTEYERAVSRLGAGGIEQQRLGREEAAAGRTFQTAMGRFGTQRGAIEAERLGAVAGLGRREALAKRRFVEGGERAREELLTQRGALREREAETGFTAAGRESMLERVMAQRGGRALETMVAERGEELGDVETQRTLTALRSAAQQAEVGYGEAAAGEQLRGVQEAGTYRRDILGQQLGAAGGEYEEALASGAYGLERARLAREETEAAAGFGIGEAARRQAAAQEAGVYQLGTAGLAEQEARETEEYGLGSLAQQLTEAEAEQAYAGGTSEQRLAAAQARAARSTAQRQAAYGEAQTRADVAGAQRLGRVTEAEQLYGEQGAEARRLSQLLSEAGLQRTYGQDILGQQLTSAQRAYGGPEFDDEGNIIPGTGSAAYRRAGLQETAALRALGTLGQRATLGYQTEMGVGEPGDEGYITGRLGTALSQAELAERAATGAIGTQRGQATLAERAAQRGLGTEYDRAFLGQQQDIYGIDSLLQGLGIQQGMTGLQQRQGLYDIGQQYQAGVSGIESSLLGALQGIYGQMFGLAQYGATLPPAPPSLPSGPGPGYGYGEDYDRGWTETGGA